MVKKKQMTITWHVDNLKVSHKFAREVIKFLSWLKGIYGDIKFTQGKKHDYLGMDLDYSDAGVVHVSMIKYLNALLSNFPKLLGAKVAMPRPEGQEWNLPERKKSFSIM